jgi:hypothetical protein
MYKQFSSQSRHVRSSLEHLSPLPISNDGLLTNVYGALEAYFCEVSKFQLSSSCNYHFNLTAPRGVNASLPRKHVSLSTQLRTGHYYLSSIYSTRHARSTGMLSLFSSLSSPSCLLGKVVCTARYFAFLFLLGVFGAQYRAQPPSAALGPSAFVIDDDGSLEPGEWK